MAVKSAGDTGFDLWNRVERTADTWKPTDARAVPQVLEGIRPRHHRVTVPDWRRNGGYRRNSRPGPSTRRN